MSSSIGGLRESETAPNSTSRECIICTELIPEKRLRAVPTADMCVVCQEMSGDVPLVKRFDSYSGDDLVSTYFTDNDEFERELRRTNSDGAIPDEYLEFAAGDERFNNKPPVAISFTDGMASAFESEEEPEEESYAHAA